MSRPIRWTPLLFGEAVLIFWLGFAMPVWWLPQDLDDTERYFWSAQSAASVRRVVIDLPASNWSAPELVWPGPEARPVVEVASRAGVRQSLWQLQLDQEGETLYVRARLRPGVEADPSKLSGWNQRLHLQRLVLPQQVQWVQGEYLRVAEARLPQLELRGRQLTVSPARGPDGLRKVQVDQLRVQGMPMKEWRRLDTGGEDDCRVGNLHIDVNAEVVVQSLQLETAGGRLRLTGLKHPRSVTVLAAPHTYLDLPDIGDLPHLSWQALPTDRAQALWAESGRDADCARRAKAESDEQAEPDQAQAGD